MGFKVKVTEKSADGCVSIYHLVTVFRYVTRFLFSDMYEMTLVKHLRSHPRSCTVIITTSLGLRVPCNKNT